MNIWEILEIEETNDKKIIKRAYAKKLKKTHPEDDPRGFQELKQAFDMALKISETLVIENEREEELKDIEEDIRIMDFALSKKYDDILSMDYWKDYYIKFEKTMGIIQDNLRKNIEKSVNTLYFAIPKNIINYIIKEFELYKNNEEQRKFLDGLPDFKVLKIEGKTDEEIIEFYRIRNNIYLKMRFGFESLKELEKEFQKAENIYNYDLNLQIVKITFGLLQDIDETRANPLKLRNTEKYFKKVEKNHLKIFLFYENLIESLKNENLEKLGNDFYEFSDNDYIPDYLNKFLKGYVKFEIGEYENAYKYWFKKNTIITPQIMINIFKKLFISEYEKLTDEIKNDLFETKSFNLYEILSNYKLALKIDNWKRLIENLGIEEYIEAQDRIVYYLKSNFMIIPKKTLEYIYEKLNIDEIHEQYLSQELKYEIKNIPAFSFDDINLEYGELEEFSRTRYYYFKIGRDFKDNIEVEEEQEKLYKKLTELSNNFDIELINLQNIFFKDLNYSLKERKEEVSISYHYTIEKIKELSSDNSSTDEIELYHLYLQAYNNKELKDYEFERFLKINRKELIMDSQIYYYIATVINKVVGNEGEYEKCKSRLLYYYNLKAERTLIYLKKLDKKKVTIKKGKNWGKYLSIYLGVVLSVMLILKTIGYIDYKNYEKEQSKSKIDYSIVRKNINSNLKENPIMHMLEYSFENYFITGNYEKFRETYIEQHFSENAKNLYPNALTTEKLAPENKENKKIVYNAKKSEEDELSYSGFFYNDELYVVLEINSEEKIEQIFAKGYTEITEEEKEEYKKILLSSEEEK